MRYSALALALMSLNMQLTWAEQPITHTEKQVFILPEIQVLAEETDEVGQTKYDQEKIQQTANSNKTISDFLRVNPNVQFSQEALAAGKQGELKATDISINGALAYDNKIMLDNVSLNNHLNPASGSNEFGMTGMGGSSFATTINTDLICELNVLDSNVSAEYGEFTGGVIQAKTCAPKSEVGKLHGNMSYDYTSSAWSKYNYIDEAEALLFEDNPKNDGDNYQKDFVKQGIAASLYGNLSEKIGFSLAVSQRWSDIDLKSNMVNQVQSANQQRENQNVNLNAYIKLNPQHQLKLGLQYQNDQADLNQPHVKDSGKKIDETNHAFEVELLSNLDQAKLTQSLVYQQQARINDSQRNESIGWIPSSQKNWSNTAVASEGGFGDQEQALDTLEYKIKAEFQPFQFANIEHQFTVGAGYGHYEADWSRLADAYSYFLPNKSTAGITSCLNDLGDLDLYCEEKNAVDAGQYHIRRTLLGEGNIDVQQDRAHLFMEDKINWNNTLKLNLGLRSDYDSLTKETNLAPRTSVHYLPFADERLKLTTGWSRYYANNVFGYKLLDGINTLSYNQTRNSINDDWQSTGYASSSNVQRSKLDTPVTDETVFAISSRIGLFDAQLKYVHRDNKDQIRKQMISTSPINYIYDNLGKSEADVYTLSLANHTPIQWDTSLNRLSLGVDYTDVTRNFNSYEDSMNPLTYDPYILYEGKIIHEANRPADNFARPWTARLAIDTQFTNLPLKISQLLRYRSAYDAMVSSSIAKDERPEYNGFIIDTAYHPTRIGSAFNWDIRSTYDVKLAKDQLMTLGLTINNLLNRHNKYTTSGSDTLRSEIGRQFVADISFKF